MTDSIAITTALVPTLAVLVGILINRTDANRLSGDIRDLRAEIHQLRDMLVTTVINHADRIGKLEGKS